MPDARQPPVQVGPGGEDAGIGVALHGEGVGQAQALRRTGDSDAFDPQLVPHQQVGPPALAPGMVRQPVAQRQQVGDVKRAFARRFVSQRNTRIEALRRNRRSPARKLPQPPARARIAAIDGDDAVIETGARQIEKARDGRSLCRVDRIGIIAGQVQDGRPGAIRTHASAFA